MDLDNTATDAKGECARKARAQALTRQLVTSESAQPEEGAQPAAARVCEKVRVTFGTMMGATGFRALLTRAVEVGTREAPELAAIVVLENGALAGPGSDDDAACSLITARLIELLLIFIGDSLTVRLMHTIWPRLTPGSALPVREDLP